MKKILSAIVGIWLFGSPGVSAQSPTDTVVSLLMETNNTHQWILVEVMPNNTLHVRPLDTPAEVERAPQADIFLPIAKISSVTIEPPSHWLQLLKAVSDQSTQIATVKNLAMRYANWTGLPDSNAADLAFNACDALRSAGALNECQQILDIISRQAGPPVKARADLERVLLLVSQKRIPEAEVTLNGIPRATRSESSFSRDCLVRGRVAFLNKQYRASLDFYTQALTHAETSDSWLPECMYFIASSYLEISKESRPDASDTNFQDVGNTVFTDLVTFYPTSTWATQARKEHGCQPWQFQDAIRTHQKNVLEKTPTQITPAEEEIR